ncbi:hypothetical protein DM860_012566 [Cuscuta australis]|uniref:Protein kinase domain-containing protein n=1 Tax=Cuscuta australis TaxID=267555 RepID=A0A328DCB6_9ASTE|nr:hypothetical protein DM860_012566 [Cuscuta australis]
MEFLNLFFCFSIVFLSSSSMSAAPPPASDAEILLHKIRPTLQGEAQNLMLSSWNASIPLCQWRGLKWAFENGSSLLCEPMSSPQWVSLSLRSYPSLRLVSLQLPSANLSGTLPGEISELPALRGLYLGVNSLSGAVPLELGYAPSLSDLELSGNSLAGPLPASIWNLCDRLVSLRLHGNSLSGSLPRPELPNVTCEHLQALDLGQNSFSGDFPEFLTAFAALKELDLANNNFSGQIPPGLSEMKLEKLNLSHNNFSGVLPNFDPKKFGAEVFQKNSPDLCGQPLKPCLGHTGLAPGAIAGIVIGLMAGFVVIVSLLIGHFQGRKKKRNTDEDEEDDEEEDRGENKDFDGNGAEGKLIVFQGGEHLTLDDVLNATGQVMEKSSYGTVYKAKLADGGNIVLRLLREGSCLERHCSFPAIKKLGRVRHESLVPLRAFYQGKKGEKLLIYDYFPCRTLFSLLHEAKVGKPVLNWARRHKIALCVARGLEHLHSLETPITHGNIRSQNVLVDDFFVARLTEVGLDKIMIPSISEQTLSLSKADGYKAPELQKMKHCNSRTDVYAFGILLLEMLLGKKPGKSVEMTDLPSLVKGAVLEERTMEVFDAEVLKGARSPMEEGLVQALKLAMGCCSPVATVRPCMEEVVRQLEENRPRNRSALYSPAETRSESGTPI